MLSPFLYVIIYNIITVTLKKVLFWCKKRLKKVAFLANKRLKKVIFIKNIVRSSMFFEKFTLFLFRIMNLPMEIDI